MNLLLVSMLGAVGTIIGLTGCVSDHSGYVKNMDKLKASEYSKIQVGSPQNYTAIKMRQFDRSMQHETSNSDDPGVQAQIANHGDIAYYTDNTAAITQRFIQMPVPIGAHSSWDKYAVRDVTDMPDSINNYVALGSTVITDGVPVVDKQDYLARIIDEGGIIHYSDVNESIKFVQTQLPDEEVHTDWDSYFLSGDERYGLFKATEKGVYRLIFINTKGAKVRLDFQPMASGYQSTETGGYRAIMYYPEVRSWYTFDYLPTQKLICLDLARAYDKVTNDRNRALTQAAFTGVMIALGGYGTITFSGTAQSDYNGYYAGHNWTGTGTHQYSGYAQTYNYGYLALGAVQLLDTVFSGNGSVSKVRTAIQQNQCGFDV